MVGVESEDQSRKVFSPKAVQAPFTPIKVNKNDHKDRG